MLGCLTGTHEGAPHVDRHHPIPLVERDLLQGTATNQQRRVVDQTVDVARFVEQRDHILFVTDVADNVAAGQDVGRDHIGTTFAQLADETSTDATSAAGDDDPLVSDAHWAGLTPPRAPQW